MSDTYGSPFLPLYFFLSLSLSFLGRFRGFGRRLSNAIPQPRAAAQAQGADGASASAGPIHAPRCPPCHGPDNGEGRHVVDACRLSANRTRDLPCITAPCSEDRSPAFSALALPLLRRRAFYQRGSPMIARIGLSPLKQCP